MEADWKRDTLAESHNRKAGRGEVVGGGVGCRAGRVERIMRDEGAGVVLDVEVG